MKFRFRQAAFSLLTGVVFMGAASSALAQSDTMVFRKAGKLQDAPGDFGKTVIEMPAQSVVTRLPARQGPWLQVKASTGQTGWVHMFDLTVTTREAPTSNSATDALRSVGNLFSKGNQGVNRTSTSTVGIRGLTAEDINNAQPNEQAVASVEAWRVSADQARQFASAAQLKARAVNPLPEPAATADTTSNSNANPAGQKP